LNITHNLASAKQVLGGDVGVLGRWEGIEFSAKFIIFEFDREILFL
jgi:hypothetical protein